MVDPDLWVVVDAHHRILGASCRGALAACLDVLSSRARTSASPVESDSATRAIVQELARQVQGGVAPYVYDGYRVVQACAVSPQAVEVVHAAVRFEETYKDPTASLVRIRLLSSLLCSMVARYRLGVLPVGPRPW